MSSYSLRLGSVILYSLVLLLSVAHFSQAATPKCPLSQPVRFADFDWDSSRLHVAIARHIVENAFGCKTKATLGATLPLYNGLIGGELDVAMEIWKDGATEVYTKALEKGVVQELGINFDDGVQGFFVPRYVIEGDKKRGIAPMAPELRAVTDLPKYKKLFKDPEEPSKGRFYNCILGWVCETTATKKLKVYGLNKHFTNFRPGTGAALAAAIKGHYDRGKPIVAFYWGPTSLLGQLDLVRLQESPYSKKIWDQFIKSKKPARTTAHPSAMVVKAVHKNFPKRAPQITAFLEKYRTASEIISKMLAYMEDKKAKPAQAAKVFFKRYPKVWKPWLSQSQARSIEDSLKK